MPSDKKPFFKPDLRIGASARRVSASFDSGLSEAVLHFKQTYVLERTVLDRFRDAQASAYRPSSRLDGEDYIDSPEVKKPKNEWKRAYDKVTELKLQLTPAQFVRIVFRLLRGSSEAAPMITQLATPKWSERVSAYLKTLEITLREDFLAESQRVTSKIRFEQKVGSCSLPLAVYCALVDTRADLSALFKFCMATTTIAAVRENNENDKYCKALEDLAKNLQLLAAMEYTLFPKQYDSVWGKMIPNDFRVAAPKIVANALV
jgi:hypothetical protein